MSKFYVWIDNPTTQIETDIDYNGSSQRINGFMPKTKIQSKVMNSALRQATLVTAALMNALNINNVDMFSSLEDVTEAIRQKIASSSLNIVNGSGLYSVVGLEDTTRANYAYGRANLSIGHKNKTYQRDSVAFGGGNQSGMTEEEFNNYWWDSTTNKPKNGGRGTSINNILDADGRTYADSYGFEFTIGTSNFNLGKLGFVGGENNLNYGNKATLFGQGIKNFGKYALLVGGDDGYTASDNPSITNYGHHNFFFGKALHSYSGYLHRECNFVTLLGENLKATNDNCVIVGKNCGNANRGGNDLRFAVGTGTTADTGKNGFEVYEGGIVRVNRKPTYVYDVARLEEINELDTKLNTKIDTLYANGFIVVQTLPTASKDTVGKIYLVPHEEVEENNIYDEYITVSSGNAFSWEKIGSTLFKQIVDAELSNTSENPVQNKVINEALLKNLLNVTIIDQDLSEANFVPTPNTYYRHTNRYNTLYNYGTILFYNGTDYENVEVLNNLVSEWSGLANVVGGYGTILARSPQGKYTAVGIGNASVTKVGFVPTYTQRTDANGVKSTVLATGKPVNDVDTVPLGYLNTDCGVGKLYKYTLTFTNSTGTLDIYSTLANANITTTTHPGGAESGYLAQFPSGFMNTIRKCIWHGEQGDSQALILIGTMAETIENVLKQILFLEFQGFDLSYNTLLIPTIASISGEQ